MPTTNARLVTVLLDALEETGVPYAVLHREADAAAGVIEADVDVAIGRPACEILPTLEATLSTMDVGLALIWPYDTNSLATFWLGRDCTSGVQLDLLCDPDGRGRYGLRTEAALRFTERGERWLRLIPEVEHTYLVSKRWAKSDVARLRDLIKNSGGNCPIELANKVLVPRAARAVSAAYAGHTPPRYARQRWALHNVLSRKTRLRLCHPVGVLVRIRGVNAMTIAQHVCGLLDKVMVAADITVGRSLLARAHRFIRLRQPHVLICLDDVKTRPDVDLLVSPSGNIEQVVEAVWRGLVESTNRNLKEWASVSRW